MNLCVLCAFVVKNFYHGEHREHRDSQGAKRQFIGVAQYNLVNLVKILVQDKKILQSFNPKNPSSDNFLVAAMPHCVNEVKNEVF